MVETYFSSLAKRNCSMKKKLRFICKSSMITWLRVCNISLRTKRLACLTFFNHTYYVALEPANTHVFGHGQPQSGISYTHSVYNYKQQNNYKNDETLCACIGYISKSIRHSTTRTIVVESYSNFVSMFAARIRTSGQDQDVAKRSAAPACARAPKFKPCSCSNAPATCRTGHYHWAQGG